MSYIYKALARRETTGIETALPRIGRPGRKLDRHVDALAAYIESSPDATLAELAAWSACERGVTVCVATMWATVQALGLTLKKSRSMPPSRSATTWPPPAKSGVPTRTA